MTTLSKDDLDSFFKAATSLKLYSRAELIDGRDKPLIEKPNIELLPNDQAFKIVLAETTILIGKGTAKSNGPARDPQRKNGIGEFACHASRPQRLRWVQNQ